MADTLISCLMVTQAARLPLAALAIGDFARQTHAPRELVIVHDGGDPVGQALQALADAQPTARIRILGVPAGLRLGALRNRSVAAAAGEWICQWDDDDRCHPQRLELQWNALCAAQAEFCFLVDQLHWFAQRRELYWDDWDGEAYPLNFVQGSLLGRRALMPAFPDLALGEDTGAIRELLRAGHRIARLRGAGWCHVYVYHGANVWSAQHHQAITQAKRFGAARLMRHEATLREKLADYVPPLGPLTLPHAFGALHVEGD